MDSTIASWEQQLAAIWDSFDDEAEAPFLAAIDAHLAELPTDSAIVAFEVAASRDSTGHPDLAVPFYRYALDIGLEGERRRRAVIQLASSLRNLGAVDEAVSLLESESNEDSDYLADELTAFLALCLADVGREREAAGLALATLAPYLSRYQSSLRGYAREFVGATVDDEANAGTEVDAEPHDAEPHDAEQADTDLTDTEQADTDVVEAELANSEAAAVEQSDESRDSPASDSPASDAPASEALASEAPASDAVDNSAADSGAADSGQPDSSAADSGAADSDSSDAPANNETNSGESEWGEPGSDETSDRSGNDGSDRAEEWTEPASGADSVRVNRD